MVRRNREGIVIVIDSEAICLQLDHGEIQFPKVNIHLGAAFKNAGHTIVQVYSRDMQNAALLAYHIKAEAIHGNKAQNARQRALTNFKAQTTRVLVATDIAARGIDVDDLAFVINFEMPNIPETYVHRIGRTGRAGANGTAYSFVDAEEKAFLRDIEKLIAKKIPVVDTHPFPLTNHNPIPAPKQQQGQRRHSQGRPQQSHTGGKQSRWSGRSRSAAR